MLLIKAKTYYIKTFGCQTNKVDSEKISFFLDQVGLKKSQTINKADLVIINSCAVRQSAEDRVIGLAYNLNKKEKQPIVIVSGCLLYHKNEYLKEKFVDRVNYFVKSSSWPEFIFQHWAVKVNCSFSEKKDVGPLYVSIIDGCSNFCSYCVVPYARGREKSLDPEKIICQIKQVAKNNGRQKVFLLGQNVNSYGKDLKKVQLEVLDCDDFTTPFARLIGTLNNLKEVEEISFLTSNPHDLDNDIIKSLKFNKVSRQLHLPVQSGDEEILQKMNRKYTAIQYIKLVEKIKKEVPDILISTDIIVGFPGETKQQFLKTVDLCQKVDFYKAYINKYSPRPGTVAEKLVDDVSWAEKKRRWQILEKLINSRQVF